VYQGWKRDLAWVPCQMVPLPLTDHSRGYVRAGGWDAYERLRDQAYDTISAEVSSRSRNCLLRDRRLPRSCEVIPRLSSTRVAGWDANR
jgi:hypothetical protein